MELVEFCYEGSLQFWEKTCPESQVNEKNVTWHDYVNETFFTKSNMLEWMNKKINYVYIISLGCVILLLPC